MPTFLGRFPRTILAVIITFLLTLLSLYLAPAELLLLFLAAVPGGFVERRLIKSILAGLLGALFAGFLVFLILWYSSPANFPSAVGTIPELFALSLLFPAIMGGLGGGVGAEIWHLSIRRQPQATVAKASP